MAMSLSKPDGGPNRNAVRRSKRREAMIAAADALYEEFEGENSVGYEATTIDLIVERAEVSRRSFFNHFTGKADVLLLDFRTVTEIHVQAFKNRPAEEAPLDSALLAMADVNQPFFSSDVNRRRFARQLKMGLRPSQWPQLRDWEMRLAKEMSTRIDGENSQLRARIIAAQASLIIRIASENWFTHGLSQGKPIEASLREVEALTNRVVADCYPLPQFE